MSGFGDRLRLGNSTKERLIHQLTKSGFRVASTGQEELLTAVHHYIRFRYDKTSEFARHFPDLLIVHTEHEPFYAESKATSKAYWDGPNFSIESASLEVCRILEANGIRVAIFFENRPGEFYGDWASAIKVYREMPYEVTRKYKGSGTPMTLIRKADVPPLGDFIVRVRELQKVLEFSSSV